MNFLLWILHWCGQGMKLALFSLLGVLCTFPISLFLGFLEWIGNHEKTPEFVGLLLLVAYLFFGALGLAVFTAVVASQLKDQPLRPYVRKGGTPGQVEESSDQESTKSESPQSEVPAAKP